MQPLQQKIDLQGFAIAEDIFSPEETAQLQQAIAQADNHNPSFRTGKDLFAIRHLLHEIPALRPLIATEKFKTWSGN